jgi:hypothetical protein
MPNAGLPSGAVAPDSAAALVVCIDASLGAVVSCAKAGVARATAATAANRLSLRIVFDPF